jgi:hypothetical protein
MENLKEFAGHKYIIGDLNAFEQLHVGRRLSQTLVGIVTALAAGISTLDDVLGLGAGPLAEAFGEMSDSNVDFVVNKCLGVCKRKQDNGYAKVFTNGVLMFEDIKLDTLMGLTVVVLQENMGSFFPMSQPTSGEPK